MVFSDSARIDVDNLMLTKTISYTSKTFGEDMGTGAVTPVDVTKNILFQGTVVKVTDFFVRQGLLNAGDLKAIFRYQYTAEADGTAINPTITSKEKDEFTYLSKNYRIKEITPVTSEDDGIICYEAICSDIGV